ncbi:hypothetical protein ACH4E7_40990, partial [Kitasatospora sp. NPDC018058]|uniref:hypothetical protein n=1 Tax=Kitasatospora sp. NPDC018058 TaxID=3364025 RepID=UPI0037C09746
MAIMLGLVGVVANGLLYLLFIGIVALVLSAVRLPHGGRSAHPERPGRTAAEGLRFARSGPPSVLGAASQVGAHDLEPRPR